MIQPKNENLISMIVMRRQVLIRIRFRVRVVIAACHYIDNSFNYQLELEIFIGRCGRRDEKFLPKNTSLNI